MTNRLPSQYRVTSEGVLPAPPTLQTHSGPGLGARLIERTAAYVGAYPAATLATAFVTGLAIGRLVKSL